MLQVKTKFGAPCQLINNVKFPQKGLFFPFSGNYAKNLENFLFSFKILEILFYTNFYLKTIPRHYWENSFQKEIAVEITLCMVYIEKKRTNSVFC